MTYLEIVNAVLRRLREDEVLTFNETPYSALIGDFVNETKREVEAAWGWTALRATVPVTTVQGTTEYSLVGSGKRSRTLSIYNTTTRAFLLNRTTPQIKRINLESGESPVIYYYYEGFDSSGDRQVVFNTPDQAYVINFELVIPQPNLIVGATELTIDEYPVILGAYAKAITERGEDGGQMGMEAANAYVLAMGDSISFDQTHTYKETNWFV